MDGTKNNELNEKFFFVLVHYDVDADDDADDDVDGVWNWVRVCTRCALLYSIV